ncbi:hypothetical protein MTP10_15910 [Nonomuraea sp. 3-1Str]|uniref:hypothetical protein n=1 Tax=Nonomuraea sp. 3-1Str TaxID=2929801 RepID=UPI00285F6225|nr:hypothetical protein [Nonomuraea sp. 3-1Str]MDR8410218.1 hypothetical protein [Nonomuraea sp. 3-1Str]
MHDRERPTPQWPDPDSGVDQALGDVLKVIGTASRTLTLRNAMIMACCGDRPQLAACLEAMPPGQLIEVAAAARLLSTTADQALTRTARDRAPYLPSPASDGL